MSTEEELVDALIIPRYWDCPAEWRDCAKNDPEWWGRIIASASVDEIHRRLAIASIY